MKFTSPATISVVIEKILNNGGRGGPGGHYFAIIVSGADNHPKTAIVKTTLSIAEWQVTQIGVFYTVRNHEASLKDLQAVCKEIKDAYGI